jgi:cobyrinic acid a,c-diamide synthase
MIGAALPEGYAEELSANRRLCAAVAQLAHDHLPIIAEGVGLPWLTRDFDGRPMCGILDASAQTSGQTIAGYREATAPATSPLAPAGARITGYKQHRAIVTPRSGPVPAWTWAGGNPEGFIWRQVHASQLGLHWAGAPEIARRLVAAMLSPAEQVAMLSPGQQAATQSSGQQTAMLSQVQPAAVIPPPDDDPGEQTLSLSGLTPPTT